MFLFHKKKKNLCWDIDTLIQWNHVSIGYKKHDCTEEHQMALTNMIP